VRAVAIGHPEERKWQRYTLRAFRPGDEAGLASLFAACFEEQRTPEECHWKILENPRREDTATVFVALDESQIVAHVGGLPVEFKAGAETVRALIACDFAVLPERRRGLKKVGLFLALARMVEEVCRDRFALTFGFPVPAAHRMETRYLGGKDAGGVPSLACPLTIHGARWLWGRKGVARLPATWLAGHKGLRRGLRFRGEIVVRRVARFDPFVDELWEDVSGCLPFAVQRDSLYLNWRYARPGRPYLLLVAEDGRRPVGYVTFRTVRFGSVSLCLIMDIMPPTGTGVSERLLCEVMLYARANRVDAVRCWMNEKCAFYDVLMTHGFVRTSSTDRLVYKVFRRELETASIGRRENWYLTLSDSDGL